MRTLTYKRYHGTANRTVPRLNGHGISTRNDWRGRPFMTLDQNWIHVREGYEIVTLHVPKEFDIVYRYLRLHGLAKYVHDFNINSDGWGWHLDVDECLILTFRNPMAVLDEPTSTLKAAFKTRQERRHAMKVVVNHLKFWRDERAKKYRK